MKIQFKICQTLINNFRLIEISKITYKKNSEGLVNKKLKKIVNTKKINILVSSKISLSHIL